jgi:hypothetical protein
MGFSASVCRAGFRIWKLASKRKEQLGICKINSWGQETRGSPIASMLAVYVIARPVDSEVSFRLCVP